MVVKGHRRRAPCPPYQWEAGFMTKASLKKCFTAIAKNWKLSSPEVDFANLSILDTSDTALGPMEVVGGGELWWRQ